MRVLRGSTEAQAAAIVFGVCLIVGLLQGEKRFYFDSGEYWYLSKTFAAGGHFSLFSFEYNGVRGYALPLVYFLLSEGMGWAISADWLQVLIFNSLLFALIGAVLAPRLAGVAWPRFEWGLGRRLVLSGLFVVFWSGYLNYPLSDLPALAAGMLAILAVAKASRGRLVAAGLGAAFAVNARPAYLLLAALLLGITLWEHASQGNRGGLVRPKQLLGPALFLLGAAVITVPQSLIQHHADGGYDPLPGGGELAALQYTEGLRLDRYETYVGEPRLMMKYRDPDTKSILRELPGGTVGGTGEYARLVVDHPLTMAGLFLRHVVNGLDQRYTTPYVEELAPPSRKLLRLAGFLLAFAALLRIAWPAARRSLGRTRWFYLAALLLASGTAVVSAMETRFMLPVVILVLLLCLQPGWPSPFPRAKTGPARYGISAAIGAAAAIFLLTAGLIAHQANEHLRLVRIPTPAEVGR